MNQKNLKEFDISDDFQWIVRTSELVDACGKMRLSPYITVDTEFERTHTYWPILSLIQVSCENGTWLIDCLSKELDLAPFGEIFLAPDLMKVFHGARQDIEIFHLLFKGLPDKEALFDTQLGAMACFCVDFPSYERLCHTLLGKGVDKSLQRTNWMKRPLTKAEITYAVRDVTYLRPIYNIISARLSAEGRRDWIADEMASLLNEETYCPPVETLVNKLKMRRGQKNVGVVFSLTSWREAEARKRNIPRERVMKGVTILDIAQGAPTSAQALARLQLSKECLKMCPPELLLSLVAQGLKEERAAPGGIEDGKDGSDARKIVCQMLKLLAGQICKSASLSNQLLAPSQKAFDVLANQHTPKQDSCSLLSGWRFEVFGRAALQLIKGDILLGLEEGGDIAVHVPATIAS